MNEPNRTESIGNISLKDTQILFFLVTWNETCYEYFKKTNWPLGGASVTGGLGVQK